MVVIGLLHLMVHMLIICYSFLVLFSLVVIVIVLMDMLLDVSKINK